MHLRRMSILLLTGMFSICLLGLSVYCVVQDLSFTLGLLPLFYPLLKMEYWNLQLFLEDCLFFPLVLSLLFCIFWSSVKCVFVHNFFNLLSGVVSLLLIYHILCFLKVTFLKFKIAFISQCYSSPGSLWLLCFGHALQQVGPSSPTRDSASVPCSAAVAS